MSSKERTTTDYDLDANPQNVQFDRPDCSLPSITDFEDRLVPRPALVAMALNEAGQMKGRGKFYVNVSGSIEEDAQPTREDKTVHLVFRNTAWGPYDIKIWNEMDLRARFESICSDARLNPTDLVIPMHIHFPEQGSTQDTIEFKKAFTNLKHVAVMYNPRPRAFKSDQLSLSTTINPANEQNLVVFNTHSNEAMYASALKSSNTAVLEYMMELWDTDNEMWVIRYRDIVMEQYQCLEGMDSFLANDLPEILSRPY